ncbi:MAG: adenosylcobinamide-phosphate synthase CbiB [Candidatus Methanomethylophilaceae archaeon]|nr:adenosylcobinamide-phosphate synthase CbiB [Candidatus Methanomethylophilaceae archaeon]
MQLWVDAVLIVVIALLIDRFIGEVPNSIHPLRWMGNLLGAIDRRIKNRGTRMTSVLGFLSYLLVFILFSGIGLFLTTLCRYYVSDLVSPEVGEVLWVVVTAFIFKISFAIFSFRKHCDPIRKDLDEGRVEDAAAKVQMIVSRNTKGMDAEHIASSCCETVSENLVDSVYSPVLYFGLFGIPGAVMFRCANLMDAMWGYLNEKYGRLGFFPAKFDDVLGFITSRVSPYFVALAGMIMHMDWRAAVPAAKAEHTKTPSPNSGWSMTAVAAVLGISMEKKGVYVMGTGPMPTTEDVRRCCRLVELSSVLFLLTVGLILYVLLGVHVQCFAEGITYDILQWIGGFF